MKHPIWAIMREEGRTLRWLAKRIGYQDLHLYAVRAGRRGVSPRLRRACAAALGRPESELWLPEKQPEEVRA